MEESTSQQELTAPQKIKYEIIFIASNPEHDKHYADENLCDEFSSQFKRPSDLRKELERVKNDGEKIEDLFSSLRDDDFLIQDDIRDFAGMGEDSDINPEWSRNYESKSKCIQVQDGSWVGWTYWYGGGKHGCPEDIAWIDDAYNVRLLKTEYVPKRFFEKVEEE